MTVEEKLQELSRALSNEHRLEREIERLQSCLYAQESVPILYERIEQLTAALQALRKWAEAYPLGVFPEPDLKRAHKVLNEHGMTLDAIAASAMRHVLRGVVGIIGTALPADGLAGLAVAAPEPPLEHDPGDVDRRPGDDGGGHDDRDPVEGHVMHPTG